jgi:RNA polymerase-binding transcription factor DksA
MSDVIFTRVQLTAFSEELTKRRKRLIIRLQSQRVVDARVIPLVGCMYEQTLDHRMAGAYRKLLAEIDSALQRLQHGVFGLCTRCGQKIDSSCLHAAPATRLCPSCETAGLPPLVSFRGPSVGPVGREPLTCPVT